VKIGGDIAKNSYARKHSGAVSRKLNEWVGLLNNVDELVPKIQKLGKDHVALGVKPKDYPIVG